MQLLRLTNISESIQIIRLHSFLKISIFFWQQREGQKSREEKPQQLFIYLFILK